MKALKKTIIITAEVLSIDAAPSIIHQALAQISSECPEGKLVMDDGDTVAWATASRIVEF